MRRITVAALLFTCGCVAAGAQPAVSYTEPVARTAGAIDPLPKGKVKPTAKQWSRYTKTRNAVKRELTNGAAEGRNIRRRGVRIGGRVRKASSHQVGRAIKQLDALRDRPAFYPYQQVRGLPAKRLPANIAKVGYKHVPPGGIFAQIRGCESSTSGLYGAVSPGGTYTGAYQFDATTWQAMGGSGIALWAPPWEQDYRAVRLYNARGGAPWPNCGG